MRACRFSSVCCIYRCQFSFTSQSFPIASCQTRVHACRFSSPCCTYERHVWFTNQWFTNPRIGSHVINVSIRTFCVHVAHMNVTSHPRTNYSLSHHVTSYPRNKHSRTHVSDRISSICRHAPLVSMLQIWHMGLWMIGSWMRRDVMGSWIMGSWMRLVICICTSSIYAANTNDKSHPRAHYSRTHDVTSHPRINHSQTHVWDRISSNMSSLVSMLHIRMTRLIQELTMS